MRGFLIAASLAAALAPAAVAWTRPPATPLSDRIASARADLRTLPCGGDADCRRRVAHHGLAPDYFEAPDEWLATACLQGDEVACAYLDAADGAPLVGYGCEGATGPLHADAEDEFPVCMVIERAPQ